MVCRGLVHQRAVLILGVLEIFARRDALDKELVVVERIACQRQHIAGAYIECHHRARAGGVFVRFLGWIRLVLEIAVFVRERETLFQRRGRGRLQLEVDGQLEITTRDRRVLVNLPGLDAKTIDLDELTATISAEYFFHPEFEPELPDGVVEFVIGRAARCLVSRILSLFFDNRTDIAQHVRHHLTGRITPHQRRVIQLDARDIEPVRFEVQRDLARDVTLDDNRQIGNRGVFDQIVESVDHLDTRQLLRGRTEQRRLVIGELIDLDQIVVLRANAHDAQKFLDRVFLGESEQIGDPAIDRLLAAFRYRAGIDDQHFRQTQRGNDGGANALSLGRISFG